jgi:NADPH:quinone reductase-like Zn-dependent oxidoreductase
MKAIVVTDQAAGTAGMKLVERPEPQAAINDVVVQVHAAGFVNTETVEHPFGTMKARMGATHFLTKTLPKVAAEMALVARLDMCWYVLVFGRRQQ